MQNQVPKNWQKVKLEDVAEVLNGYAFSSQSFIPKNDKAFPVFKMGNIKEGGGLQWTGKEDYFLEDQARKLSHFITEPGDILMCMTDMKANVRLLGYSAFIKNEKFLVNQRVGRIKAKKDRVEPRFLFYYLNSPKFIGYIRSTARSGVQVNLTTEEIRQSSLFIPNYKEQKQIAFILSAFDDKIEVNKKITKSLEEMAQAIFKEWFVKFRFPGHQKAEFIDSDLGKIPNEWEIGKLGDIVDLVYGKGLKEEDRKEGSILVVGSSGIVGYHNKKLVAGPGIVIGRKGTVGSILWIDDDFYPIDTTYYIQSKFGLHYCYFLLKRQTFITGDSAVPGLNRGIACSNIVIIPDSRTVGEYEKIVTPIFTKLAEIKKENQKLVALRDLLLPRLMRGDIRL